MCEGASGALLPPTPPQEGFDAAGDPSAVLVAVDPAYYRPAEVEVLWGNPAKAKRLLGWEPRTTFAALAHEMTLADLELVAKGDLTS